MITIITGERKVDLVEYFYNNSNEHNRKLLLFPESKICHPYDLVEDISEITNESIDKEKDLVVITYSDVIFDAICLQIAKKRFKHGKLINVTDDNLATTYNISEDGELTEYPQNFLNIRMILLRELLKIRRERVNKRIIGLVPNHNDN